MEIKKVTRQRIVLELSWDEATWLANYIQNPKTHTKDEPTLDRDNRLNLWNKLTDTL